ncbi:MAG TPA: tripartite tricarboxylate transporter permease [Candidatus Saccharimonadales bacterium]|jgi:putative tricarboxylic transport membrane protein|nr:tripartite tricarboxylate transporter permease [Candidatus Saccharimonadales bacterium]
MSETLHNLYIGFSVALAPSVLLYAFVGCVVGTLVGVLPGIGPLAGISLLLPASFGLDATSAMVLLAGIYYGAMYGGSTTSILMRIPGEAASVMTCIDGYEMTRQGRAGPALAIAAIGSYIAGTVSIVGLMLLAPPLASFALRFGPPEYFALLLLGLLVLAYMSSGSMLKSLAMAALGLLLGMIGIDPMTGFFRFSYGLVELGDGIGVVPVAVGLFGLSEILLTAGQPTAPEIKKPRLKDLLPSNEEWRASIWPIGRGTVLGFFIGIIPGSAHIIASFVSYAVEKRLSKHPERFGHGAIEGVAGPESANNSATSGAFVPMLALGVPSGPIPAVMIAAMMVHGISPGPLLISQQPELFWGFIASMYVGNVVLLILNLPLVGLFVNVLRVPYPLLYPAILVFCVLGVYAVNGSAVDIGIMTTMGALGYLLRKFDFETAPVVLGLILAPMLEMSFRQSLAMSSGRYMIFVNRPIASVMLLSGLVLLLLNLVPFLMKTVDWRQRLGIDVANEGEKL